VIQVINDHHLQLDTVPSKFWKELYLPTLKMAGDCGQRITLEQT
jgi:hypothetical protein